jgi:hypothetical protein
MRTVTMAALAAGTLAAAGCGSTSAGASQGDAQAYGALAVQISSTAAAYGAAAAATVDPVDCASAHASYDGQVHPLVDRMRSLSGPMDQQMGMMGHGADADMSCGADAMEAELAGHDAVACATTVMDANHAEAARHVAAMAGWADHQRVRADEEVGLMGGGGMMSPYLTALEPASLTTTATCHRNGGGTFTLGP